MSGIHWARLLAAALAMHLMFSGVGAASASTTPVESLVEVVSPRLVYADGSQVASFSVDGVSCISSAGAVDVMTGSCPDTASPVTGELTAAALGFDAAREADAGDRGLPVVETSSAQADVVTAELSIRVLRPGDFTVTAVARRGEQVDPRFVPGTASGDGSGSDEEIVWRLDDLQPGVRTFSVQVRLGAVAGFDGSYMTEWVVERRAKGEALLPHVRGDGYDGPSARATTASVLRLSQRESPASGAPRLRLDAPHATNLQRSAHQGSWAGRMTADFHGGWRIDRDPSAETRDTRTYAQMGFAPEDAACRGASLSYVSPTVHGTLQASIGVPLLSDVLDFRLATSNLADAPGEAFDAEAATVGYVLDMDSSAGGDEAEPENDAGVPTLLWDGTYADAPWVSQTRLAASTEIDATDAVPFWFLEGGTEHGLLSLASLSMEVTGGDVDNRSGAAGRAGEGVRLTVPDGYAIDSVTTLTGYCTAGRYRPTTVLERASDAPLSPAVAATVTPVIPEGDYWIKASGRPESRRWKASTEVIIASGPMGAGPVPGHVDHLVTVPAGGRAEVTHTTTAGAFHRTLQPGNWRVRTDDFGILIRLAN